MACDETVAQYVVKRMLYACKAFGGVVVFVVDVYVSVSHGFTGFLRQEVVIDKWFCGLTCEFHHHACRGVGVHVGVFACDVVVFRFDYFQEDVACLGTPCNAALVSVCDIFFCHFLAGALHQFNFNAVLNFLDSHAFLSGYPDAVGYFQYQGFVLAEVCGKHGLAYGGLDFFFVVTYYTAVTL